MYVTILAVVSYSAFDITHRIEKKHIQMFIEIDFKNKTLRVSKLINRRISKDNHFKLIYFCVS